MCENVAVPGEGDSPRSVNLWSLGKDFWEVVDDGPIQPITLQSRIRKVFRLEELKRGGGQDSKHSVERQSPQLFDKLVYRDFLSPKLRKTHKGLGEGGL